MKCSLPTCLNMETLPSESATALNFWKHIAFKVKLSMQVQMKKKETKKRVFLGFSSGLTHLFHYSFH